MRIAVILMLLLLVSPAAADDWDQYRYRDASLALLMAKHKAQAKETMFVDEAAVKAHVSYGNSGRAISGKKKKFIRNWVEKKQLPREYLKIFSLEIQVFEGGKSYWLSVQQPLLDDLWKDFQLFPSDIDVYVILIGFVNAEPVFLMNGYDDYFGDDEAADDSHDLAWR